MLRDILLGIVVGLFLLAVMAWALIGSKALVPILFLAALLGALAFENQRHKKLQLRASGDGWTRTSEVFVDPETSQPVEVWFNAETGERRHGAPPKSN